MMPIDVPLPAQCTIIDAPAVSALLLDAFAADGPILIDCSAVAHCDLSFVQIVEAGRRMAARDGRTLTLARPAPPAVAATLARAGVATVCPSPDADFWHHGVLPQ